MKTEKNIKGKRNNNSLSRLDQKIGSALDLKTNEDFNNEHPDHDENGLINANISPEEKNSVKDSNQTSDRKLTETNSEEKEAVKTYSCSMHPEVISDKPGKCPKCGMKLIEKR